MAEIDDAIREGMMVTKRLGFPILLVLRKQARRFAVL